MLSPLPPGLSPVLPPGNFFFAGARVFFRSLGSAIFLFSRVARLPEGSLVGGWLGGWVTGWCLPEGSLVGGWVGGWMMPTGGSLVGEWVGGANEPFTSCRTACLCLVCPPFSLHPLGSPPSDLLPLDTALPPLPGLAPPLPPPPPPLPLPPHALPPCRARNRATHLLPPPPPLLRGQVLPSIDTEERITLGAELEDGSVVRGQNQISHPSAAGTTRHLGHKP